MPLAGPDMLVQIAAGALAQPSRLQGREWGRVGSRQRECDRKKRAPHTFFLECYTLLMASVGVGVVGVDVGVGVGGGGGCGDGGGGIGC